jgi:Fe-S-cluster-containing hydrogenase component 2
MEILCPTAALMRILGHTVVEACLCDECWKFSLVPPAFFFEFSNERKWIMCPNVAVEG